MRTGRARIGRSPREQYTICAVRPSPGASTSRAEKTIPHLSGVHLLLRPSSPSPPSSLRVLLLSRGFGGDGRGLAAAQGIEPSPTPMAAPLFSGPTGMLSWTLLSSGRSTARTGPAGAGCAGIRVASAESVTSTVATTVSAAGAEAAAGSTGTILPTGAKSQGGR